MKFKFLNTENGVGFLTEKDLSISESYLSVREKENRIFSDEEVLNLPFTSIKNIHANEWKLRQNSSTRFVQYLKTKKDRQLILDIGCGNGWFSKEMANVSERHHIIGLDVNITELEQAARVFKNINLKFVYGNIFKINLFSEKFNLITLNGSVQYFSDFDSLLTILKSFLKPKGEIHIIDSPFYSKEDIHNAKKRTLAYYTNLGYPEMAGNYHHHEIRKIEKFDVLYQYKRSIIKKILGKHDSPFSWCRFTK